MVDRFEWEGAQRIDSRAYICGWCGRDVAVDLGWEARDHDTYQSPRVAGVYICHLCSAPSVIIEYESYSRPETQFPQVAPGRSVEHLPELVGSMYIEARLACSANAWTAAAMALRNVIAYVANDQGAEPNLGYRQYVEWLRDNSFLPPGGDKWVDRIRNVGNDAAHEIEILGEEQVKLVLDFTELLLRFVYEAPGRLADDVDQLQ